MEKIILVGSPNSGKTTLFNWLTGRRQKVVNYPGSTVDFALGTSLETYGKKFQIYDSPGTYSLSPKSPEEEVTYQLLFSGDEDFGAVVAVVDSTQMERQLPLVEQLKESGRPVVLALTMHDLHLKDRRKINVSELENRLGLPVVPIDGVLGGGVQDLVRRMEACENVASTPMQTSAPSVQSPKWSRDRYQQALETSGELLRDIWDGHLSVKERSRRLDHLFLHGRWGFILFIAVMCLLFSSIFWLATPFMDWVDAGFSFLADQTISLFGENLLTDFLAEGLIGSFAAVLVFVPQIFILFVGISLLEDSGYLARAAALVDRPLSWIGLNGKAFVPLLSGFACAVPAIMAARSVNNPKARWLTVFILPFMTCSARLPVYALLLSFLFFGSNSFWPGIALTALYLGAVVLGGVASAILARFVKVPDRGFFLMELPLYRRPRMKSVLINSVNRTKAYVKRSGPVIFTFAVLIWVASTFPNFRAHGPERLRGSYAAMAGQYLEPVFQPMGADWRVGVGLLSAFAAREVFVSSLAVVMNVADTGDDDASLQNSLIRNMQQAERPDGSRLFTAASVTALILFFMIALQCMSTVGVVVREMKSWKYALVQLVSMNIAAYAVAVTVFQVLKAMGLDT